MVAITRRQFIKIAGLTGAGFGAAVLLYGYAAPTSTVFGASYSGTRTKDKFVALTFDDGPNEPYTSQVLDILDQFGVKATFFLVGKNVELEPATAQATLSRGHVIGNHTYSHNANHALTSEGEHDIARAERVIHETLGVYPHLYRPPHGKKSPWEMDYTRKHGLAEIEWDISQNDQHRDLDFGKPDPTQFSQAIIEKVSDRSERGSVILLHDGFGTQHGTVKANKSLTVAALPLILEGLQKQGCVFVTVTELLKIEPYTTNFSF